jgi:hypothetical protein
MNPDRQWLNLDWTYNELVRVFHDRGFRAPTRERLLKTLIADGATAYGVTAGQTSSLSDDRVKSLLHAYDMWPRLAAGDDTIADRKTVEDDLTDLQQFSLIAQRKRLVVCEGGYLAMIPRICAVMLDNLRRDTGSEFKVGILHGSRTPIVLLEAGDEGVENTDGYPKYTIYGQCYVEGHMYGEMVDWEERSGEILELW